VLNRLNQVFNSDSKISTHKKPIRSLIADRYPNEYAWAVGSKLNPQPPSDNWCVYMAQLRNIIKQNRLKREAYRKKFNQSKKPSAISGKIHWLDSELFGYG
jgi:hypothetical protein